ncbi:hypothetical protein Nwi_1497 [Nitrobacter winogradskyi Nb-255]|uniref:Uncharacterized protein n=1 Tax=Nitrobacter winogradskyi (strain ATCC 25391 / DSM 10237 / CIP 104748 / NCIMB 11846 / Nb-255) TaxID=323098 RepID=Q3SSI3_NITWN|nr:hypothetical protein Nwi_1497 [Nitrobacter winogradskyi Nb-255]
MVRHLAPERASANIVFAVVRDLPLRVTAQDLAMSKFALLLLEARTYAPLDVWRDHRLRCALLCQLSLRTISPSDPGRNPGRG